MFSHPELGSDPPIGLDREPGCDNTFYNGLRDATRTVIDASTGGALMKKTTD